MLVGERQRFPYIAVQLTLILFHAENCLSVRQLARHLCANRNASWRLSLSTQIRKAMQGAKEKQLLKGVIEMDEAYVDSKQLSVVAVLVTAKWGTGRNNCVLTISRFGRIISRQLFISRWSRL